MFNVRPFLEIFSGRKGLIGASVCDSARRARDVTAGIRSDRANISSRGVTISVAGMTNYNRLCARAPSRADLGSWKRRRSVMCH